MRRHRTGNSSVSLAATEGGKPKRFRAALNAEMAAFKTSQRPRNVYRLAELRDQNEAKGAAVQAIRALEELAKQAEAAPPFAHPMGFHKVGDSSALGSGLHHFFPSRSFSTTSSSMAPASMHFSLAFSSLSAHNRLASDASILPKRAFHL